MNGRLFRIYVAAFLLMVALMACGPTVDPEPPPYRCAPTLECCLTDGGGCWIAQPSCMGYCPDRTPK